MVSKWRPRRPSRLSLVLMDFPMLVASLVVMASDAKRGKSQKAKGHEARVSPSFARFRFSLACSFIHPAVHARSNRASQSASMHETLAASGTAAVARSF